MGIRIRAVLIFSMFIVAALSNAHATNTDDQSNPNLVTDHSKPDNTALLRMLVGDDATAYLGLNPKIRQIKSSEPNAFALPASAEIVISEGLSSFVQTQSEMAFVLAHELGHLVLHGNSVKSSILGKETQNKSALEMELEADQFALQVLKQSGFDMRAPSAFLTRMAQKEGHAHVPFGKIYPSLGIRKNALSNHD